MNLLSATERFAALDRSEVTLEAERCLHTRDRFSSCSACYQICPVDAITPGKPPTLETKKCQSCLACLTVCPVGAYSADDEVSSLLNFVSRTDGKWIELVCQHHTNPLVGEHSDSIAICLNGCIAGLGASIYLLLIVSNIEKIEVRLDSCAECAWGSLSGYIQAQVQFARKLLAAWGKEEAVSWTTQLYHPQPRPLWEVRNPPLSRRDLFRMAVRQGQLTLARALSNEPTSGKLQPGRERQRMVVAFKYLLAEELSSNVVLEDTGFAFLEVSDACTACQACARICPTSALSFETNDEETYFRLYINPSACIGCEACMHVCGAQAMHIEHSPTIKQILDVQKPIILQEGELIRCERCNAPFASREGAHLCPVCEFRSTHPFGSYFIPGMGHIRRSSSEDGNDP